MDEMDSIIDDLVLNHKIEYNNTIYLTVETIKESKATEEELTPNESFFCIFVFFLTITILGIYAGYGPGRSQLASVVGMSIFLTFFISFLFLIGPILGEKKYKDTKMY